MTYTTFRKPHPNWIKTLKCRKKFKWGTSVQILDRWTWNVHLLIQTESGNSSISSPIPEINLGATKSFPCLIRSHYCLPVNSEILPQIKGPESCQTQTRNPPWQPVLESSREDKVLAKIIGNCDKTPKNIGRIPFRHHCQKFVVPLLILGLSLFCSQPTCWCLTQNGWMKNGSGEIPRTC